jgi:hypothetical protein
MIEKSNTSESFRGSAVNQPSYSSPLDLERAASMADEGGRAGAVMEIQDLRHNERLLHERSLYSRQAERTLRIGLIALGVGVALILGSASFYLVQRGRKRYSGA